MEDDKKSPIIERLRQFITATGLSSTQFADKAGIPRPSLSQMFHGRNKSLNNNVLEKLNIAFPNLNIVWLLFGSGEMLNNPNIEISEPQIQEKKADEAIESADNEATGMNDNLFGADVFENQNRKLAEPQAPAREKTSVQPDLPGEAPRTCTNENLSRIFPPHEGNKQIKSIIVLYSDSSFETFVPSND